MLVYEVFAMDSKQKNVRTPLFAVVGILSLAFLAMYLATRDPFRQQVAASRRVTVNTEQTAQETVTEKKQVVLQKGKRRVIGRTSLVYRGLEEGNLLLDLYLLDLDSQQFYRKKIDRKKIDGNLNLGGVKYRLVTVSNSYLVVKVLHFPRTP